MFYIRKQETVFLSFTSNSFVTTVHKETYRIYVNKRRGVY